MSSSGKEFLEARFVFVEGIAGYDHSMGKKTVFVVAVLGPGVQWASAMKVASLLAANLEAAGPGGLGQALRGSEYHCLRVEQGVAAS